MELVNELLRELFVLLFKRLQIVPFIWIKEVHQVEELSDVIIERRLGDSQNWYRGETTHIPQSLRCDALS